MANYLKGGPGIHEYFALRRNGSLTTVSKAQGLDLVVQQKLKGGDEPVSLQHYSDPGICLFVGLLKFLYVTGRTMPNVSKPSKSQEKDHSEIYSFTLTASSIGKAFGNLRFPISYHNYFQDGSTATLALNHGSGFPELHIILSNNAIGYGTIILSSRMAQTMARRIPLMYPDLGIPFHAAYTSFLEEASKHPEQVSKYPVHRQLRFEFMRSMGQLRRPEGNQTQRITPAASNS